MGLGRLLGIRIEWRWVGWCVGFVSSLVAGTVVLCTVMCVSVSRACPGLIDGVDDSNGCGWQFWIAFAPGDR